MTNKHSHYHKDVSHLKSIDVYRVLELFEVTDHTLGHAIKKLICAGKRGSKSFETDVREAADTLNRRLQMLAEDDNRSAPVVAVGNSQGYLHVGVPIKAGLPEGWTDIREPRAPFAEGVLLDLMMKNGEVRGPISYEPRMLFPDVSAWRFAPPAAPWEPPSPWLGHVGNTPPQAKGVKMEVELIGGETYRGLHKDLRKWPNWGFDPLHVDRIKRYRWL